MVELNEKALEAAREAYTITKSRGVGVEFEDGALEDAIIVYLSALPAPDDGLVERLNRWHWETANQWSDEYSPRPSWEKQVSVAMKEWAKASDEAAAALQAKDEQIERLTRERDEALDDARFAERIAEKREIDSNARAEAAEQQVQKLPAENERLREALSFYADPKNYKGEFVPGGRSERGTYVLEHHVNLVRKDAGNIARSALTQEGER